MISFFQFMLRGRLGLSDHIMKNEHLRRFPKTSTFETILLWIRASSELILLNFWRSWIFRTNRIINLSTPSTSSLTSALTHNHLNFSSAAPTDPVEDVTKFKEDFEEQYGSTHPTFYLGSYGQVRIKCIFCFKRLRKNSTLIWFKPFVRFNREDGATLGVS